MVVIFVASAMGRCNAGDCFFVCLSIHFAGCIGQSVGHLTRKSGVLCSIPCLATYFVSPFPSSSEEVVSYWRKYVHEVLVNGLGGQSMPRKSVVRLTDRLDMTLDVYHGCKTTTQEQPFLFPFIIMSTLVHSTDLFS